MRVVLAPDKLRGTYTAGAAAAALARGWRSLRADDLLEACPLADGGEGTAEALLAATGGGWSEVAVTDARGRPRTARFALLADGGAALDVAEAIGPGAIADLPPDALAASSYGAGQLLAAALAACTGDVVVGVGGTSSTDGGAGLREALGGSLPPGRRVIAALDVENPLLGPHGAAAAYGPQKGASPAQIEILERRLAGLGLTSADRPGAGAGGGLGGMLMELGAEPVAGADLVMDRAGLAARLAGADLCVTAEGRLDATTLQGKLVARVAVLCRRLEVPCVAVAGGVDPAAGAELEARTGCRVLRQGDLDLAGAELARLAAEDGMFHRVV